MGAAICGEELGLGGGAHTPSPTPLHLLGFSSLEADLVAQPTAMSWAFPRLNPTLMAASHDLHRLCGSQTSVAKRQFAPPGSWCL